jgi:glycosyltransferase involved in cell wall biosynthesis
VALRLLAITDRLTFGGIEVSLLNVVPHLQDQGVTVDVCSQGVAGELDAEFEKLGCRIHRVRKSINPFAAAREFHRLLEATHPDLVHSHKGYGSGAFALAARRSGIPIIISFHSAGSNVRRAWERRVVLRYVRRAWLRWNRRQMLRHARFFVGHSEANLASFEPAWPDDPERFRVIYNGIAFPDSLPSRKEARRELGIADHQAMLLHVGSFRPEKDHESLLEIAGSVFARMTAGLLVMVGEGALRSRVERRSRDLGLAENVRFEGGQRDVWPYYAAADVLVFPSATEGFGIALAEAQGSGLPIVATDIAAHRESVAPVQHRFLFPPTRVETAVEHVCAQLEAARAGTNEWVDVSRSESLSRFSVELAAARLNSLYSDLAIRNDAGRDSAAPEPWSLGSSFRGDLGSESGPRCRRS